jgi:acid phosphatase
MFPAGTICNATGTPRTAPAQLKHLIVILEENESFGAVSGQSTAPYLNSLASQCGIATAYNDNCFADNLVSLPHYLALTSGSNCDTGLDHTGTACITDDGDATIHTLSTASIFSQVTSWRSYMEGMPSACAKSSSGKYGAKHNPAAYYSTLPGCSANDLPIAAITCDPSAKMTACSTPKNAFTDDLANDTLAALTFISPNLNNDMHDGTVTQADNWLYTYLPLVFQSPAYLRGEVAVFILWDEQATSTFGGPMPNLFISPYITAGTSTATPMNHFAVLRAWEDALGITTHLGCASGTPPGGTGACPAGSTTDVRAALGW